jgi:dTDP-glucose 4,6-dehydratase
MLADGHEVVTIDNLVTGRMDNIKHLLPNASYEFIELDACDPYPVDGAVDAVMHMASPASPPDFRRIPFETLRAGSFATHRALEFARDKGARFLLASTSEIYGDPPAEFHPQKEDYWGNVNTIGERAVYDEAKRYAEAVTMAFHREYGLETRIVRIFNTYGPRMRADDGRVVTNFISQALRGEALTLYGGGNQTRSFCFVADLVAGIYKLLQSDEVYPVNIGNPGEFTMRELAKIVIEMTGSKSGMQEVPLPYSDDPRASRRPATHN